MESRHRKPYRRRQVGRDRRAPTSKARSTRSPCRHTSSSQGLKTSPTSPSSRTQLDGKIYGIEPGNDGNRLILDMIEGRQVRPRRASSWSKSSEQGMLAQVERATSRNEADRLPRLGAAPDERQLQDDLPHRRRRRVRPELRRRHGLHQRPRRLPRRVPERRQAASPTSSSRSPMENEIMGAILDDGKEPGSAAEEWLKANPDGAGRAGSRASPPSTASPASTRSRQEPRRSDANTERRRVAAGRRRPGLTATRMRGASHGRLAHRAQDPARRLA